MLNLRELWSARELLMFLTWRDVMVRYKQTVLGAAWAILQPAMMMVVFTVFLGRLAKVDSGDVPYPVFVYAGLLPWTFFATAISNAGNSVIGSSQMVSKIYFPRLLIPMASVAAAVVDFPDRLPALGRVDGLLSHYAGLGNAPAAAAVAAGDDRRAGRRRPAGRLECGLPRLQVHHSLPRADLDVRHARRLHERRRGCRTRRDARLHARQSRIGIPKSPLAHWERGPGVRGLVSKNLPSPIGRGVGGEGLVSPKPSAAVEDMGEDVGDRAGVPPLVKALLRLNPMTGLIAFFRAATLGGPLPWSQLGYASAVIALMLVVGLAYFRRVESTFADII